MKSIGAISGDLVERVLGGDSVGGVAIIEGICEVKSLHCCGVRLRNCLKSNGSGLPFCK